MTFSTALQILLDGQKRLEVGQQEMAKEIKEIKMLLKDALESKSSEAKQATNGELQDGKVSK